MKYFIIKKKAQISAISGRIIFQNVEFLGKEVIKIGEKNYNSLHFRFTSSDKNLPDKKKLDTHIYKIICLENVSIFSYLFEIVL